ncbi:MAG: Ig-like domain repeat protein, partial [Acidobacteriota bacterium]|nr:Ig-like domain repeat protein [Acidobacteriota bacterium]
GVAPNGIELHPILDINFTTPTATTLGSSPNPSQFGGSVTITATVNGGSSPTGNVTFLDGGNTMASRALDNSGKATFVTNGFSVGSHSITASYAGDTASAPSTTTVALVQVVNKADQTITFAAPPNKVYGDAPFTVTAVGGGSTSSVTFAAAGNCTSSGVNGSTITLTSAGSCTVTASQLGDGNYNAGADIARSFTIVPAAATIVVKGYSGTYDGHAHGATGTANGINGEDLSNLLNFGSSFTDAPGGTAHWTFAGNTNYASTAGDIAINIAQAAATIHVNGFTGVYDGHAHAVTGTAAGVNGEDLTTLLNLGATFTDAPGGSAHWTFAGNTNYASTAGDAAINIAQAAATIHVNGFTGIYDGHAHGATGTAAGVNGEDLTTLLNLGASFTDAPGGAAHWTFTGNPNYTSTAGDAAINIAQAAATIHVNGFTGVYDGHAHGATGTAAGVNGEDLTTLLNLGASFTDAPGGTAHWTFAGNTNYASVSGNLSITINQAAANVAVNGFAGVYDGRAHGASGSAKGVSGEDLSSLLNLGASFTDVPGGTAHWSFAGNTNYASTAGDAAITISQAAATFHINGFSGPYDGHAHGATGSASGVNGENLSSLLAFGASFTNVPGGTAHWTFSGNANYASANGDTAITITQAAARIQVTSYSGVYDGAAHGAAGAATGVSGENLNALLNLGAAFTNVPGGTANWTFAGNLNYAPASGTASVIINPALPIVTVNGLTLTGEVPIYDATPKTASAKATGIGGVAVAGSFTFAYNGSPIPPTLPGTYGVIATFVSANANYANTTGTGMLTIRGLRDDLQLQMNAITTLRDATTNRQDLERLNDSIRHLGEALDPDQWIDSIHATRSDGDGIFTQAKNALIPLLEIVRDARSSIAANRLQPIINRIVTDVRLLALTAINEAAARGANVDKARTDLSKGDSDINSGQYESGMEHYRQAWSAAGRA